MPNITTTEAVTPFQWIFADDPAARGDSTSVRFVYDGVGQHNRLMIFKSHDQGNSTTYLMVLVPLRQGNELNDLELDMHDLRFSWCFVAGNWEFNDIIECAHEIRKGRNALESSKHTPRSRFTEEGWRFGDRFATLEMARAKSFDLHVNFPAQIPLAFSTLDRNAYNGSTARWVMRFNNKIECWDCIDLLCAVPDDFDDWSRVQSSCWIDENMDTSHQALAFATHVYLNTTDDRLQAVAKIASTLAQSSGWDGRIRSEFFAAQADVYLSVPFLMKEYAKANGARWDSLLKSWYLPAGGDLSGVIRWLKPEDLHLVSSAQVLHGTRFYGDSHGVWQ